MKPAYQNDDAEYGKDDSDYRKVVFHFLPNVKDQPDVCLARAVRKHGT